MKANQEWFTALELAGMPGMPGSAQGVLKRVKEKSYSSRPRAYGKGSEYALICLPTITQAYLKDVTAAAIKAVGFKQKQAVAHIPPAQAATETIANKDKPMGELAVFKSWLKARQDWALLRMNSTTGDEFKDEAYEFTLFMDAAQVVAMFEREARG